MSGYVSKLLRQFIASRAGDRCEYCLIREDDTDLGLQVEHIISEKHGGPAIVPLTEIGSVTIQVLRINLPDRLLERKLLQLIGRYP